VRLPSHTPELVASKVLPTTWIPTIHIQAGSGSRSSWVIHATITASTTGIHLCMERGPTPQATEEATEGIAR